MQRLQALTNYYVTHDEDARLEPKRGMVEFLTTVKYIEQYLEKGMRILEIGAGTGRYSHYFARQGYEVDAVELMECNIEVFKKNTQPSEKITVVQRDAVDLSGVPSEKYDITLLLGPMYHLYTDKDKKAAMREALRVTKRGGVVFAAYCNNEAAVYQFCFMKGNIKNERYTKLIDSDAFKLHSTPQEVFSLHRKEEIDALMADLSVERLHYVGTDMLTVYIAPYVDKMDDEMFRSYMDYHYVICERGDCVGVSNHVLDIFKKV